MAFTNMLAGQLYTLEKLTQGGLLRLKLFSNDHTPSKTDSASLYSEVIHSDYTTKLLTPTEWVYGLDTLTGDYTATFAQQVWTFNTPVTVFGYFVTNSLGTTALFAERFPNAPVSLDGSTHKKVRITPVLGIKQFVPDIS